MAPEADSVAPKKANAAGENGEFLVVEDVVSGYGRQEIVHGISLNVHAGEIVAIIGPNGCGKSTFLKTIMGFLPAWQGRIRLGQSDLTALSADKTVRRGISFVPQGDAVFPDMTVDEHLDMGAWILTDKGEVRAARERAYELFPRLAERKRQTAKTMSGGEQQMLSIARALMTTPDLLILDEPSIGLSPKLVDLTFEAILEVNRRLGLAILMVEQNAARALESSHRGYVLEMGNNKYEGNSSDLLHDERVRRAYLGG